MSPAAGEAASRRRLLPSLLVPRDIVLLREFFREIA